MASSPEARKLSQAGALSTARSALSALLCNQNNPLGSGAFPEIPRESFEAAAFSQDVN